MSLLGRSKGYGFAVALAACLCLPAAPARADGLPRLPVGAAIELALRQHPRLALAAYLTEATRHTIAQAETGYRPRVFFGAQWIGGSINGNPPGHLGFSDFPSMGSSSTGQSTSGPARNSNFLGANSSYLVGVSLALPLYDFGRTKGRVDEARWRTTGQVAAEHTAREQIVVGVQRAYYRVLGALALVRVERESVARLGVHVEQAKALVGRGLRNPIEVPRAEAELARGQARLVAAENEERVARAVLDYAIGESTLGRFALVDERGESRVTGEVEQLVALGLRHRPELAELGAREGANRGRRAFAEASYYPTLAASGSVSLRGVGGFGNAFNYDTGLVLTWRVFDGNLFRSEVKATDARLRQLEAAREELRQGIALQIRRAHAEEATLAEAVPVARAALRHAAENLRLATGRFRAGLSPIIELADAEALYASAAAQVARAIYEHKTAAANLERAVGRRLSPRAPQR